MHFTKINRTNSSSTQPWQYYFMQPGAHVISRCHMVTPNKGEWLYIWTAWLHVKSSTSFAENVEKMAYSVIFLENILWGKVFCLIMWNRYRFCKCIWIQICAIYAYLFCNTSRLPAISVWTLWRDQHVTFIKDIYNHFRWYHEYSRGDSNIREYRL